MGEERTAIDGGAGTHQNACIVMQSMGGQDMPSLQIRNMPDDVYQGLALRAERAQRSLAQQALVELRGAAAGPLQSRRRSILDAIKRSLPSESSVSTSRPDELIRHDRER